MSGINFIDLVTKESPKEILETDFPRLGKLPIRGGWGYNQATACIIDKNDRSVEPGVPFDGVSFEYLFAEYRIYEELIIFQPVGHKFAGIRKNLTEQKTLKFADRHFDVLKFEVTAFREKDYERLKSIYEGPKGIQSSSFDDEAHQALHNSLLRSGFREYYFDITSFFGNI